MPTTSASIERTELLQELLDSDVAYFHAAAKCEDLSGYRISRMPGLESLPAACVAHPIPGYTGTAGTGWLGLLEKRLSETGCGHARIYQQVPDDSLAKHFLQNGCRAAEEIALLSPHEGQEHGETDTSGVRLRPVNSDADWSLKISVHRDIPQGPDGHASQAEKWVQMERLKCEAGYMEPFLIMAGQHTCGAVNFAPGFRIGRLKNIVISPGWRRKGVGERAASLIIMMARGRGFEVAGCFAMKSGRALNMYRKAGYFPAAQQTEWFKKL